MKKMLKIYLFSNVKKEIGKRRWEEDKKEKDILDKQLGSFVFEVPAIDNLHLSYYNLPKKTTTENQLLFSFQKRLKENESFF